MNYFTTMIKALIITAALLFSTQAMALQKFQVKQDGSIRMQAATLGITRIHVEGDRIRQIIYDNDQSGFELSNDEETGDVFMRFVGEKGSGKRESGYLITEKGLTVGLDIQPVSRRTETVLITIKANAAAAKAGSPKKSTKGFVGGSQSGGLSDDVSSSLTKFARVAILKMVRSAPPKRGNNSLISSHPGADVVGELRVAAAGRAARNVRPQDFYRSGVLAVWVEREALAPGERSWVLVIRER